MIAVLGVIPVGIFAVVFAVSLFGLCKSHKKKKGNELPITIGARKRASVSSQQTYHQDGAHAAVSHSNGTGDGGANVTTDAAVLAAVTALDGGVHAAGDGGGH